MRRKAVAVRLKTGAEDGLKEREFKVYPSTFTREPDSYGDVIAKGAFLDSLKKWEESGDVMPAMFLHDPNQIVGGATETGEDEHGWWVKGFFDENPVADRIYNLAKSRRLTELSFGFAVLEEAKVELEDGRKVNELRKVDVFEFSFLPKGFAANSDTSVVAIKSAVNALEKAGRSLSAKNENELRTAHDAIGKVLASLDVQVDDGDAKDKGLVGVKSESDATGPSVLDLAILKSIELGV